MEGIFELLHTIDLFLLNMAQEYESYLFVFFAIIVMRIKELSKSSKYKVAFVFIIGTFLHETMHYLTAFIFTFFRLPQGFSVFPKSTGDGYVLGSVKIDPSRLNWFNRAPIAMSPLLLLPLSLYAYNNGLNFYKQYYELNSLALFGFIFLITTLIVNSIPSNADFKVSVKSYSLYIWIVFISVILYFKGDLIYVF